MNDNLVGVWGQMPHWTSGQKIKGQIHLLVHFCNQHFVWKTACGLEARGTAPFIGSVLNRMPEALVNTKTPSEYCDECVHGGCE